MKTSLPLIFLIVLYVAGCKSDCPPEVKIHADIVFGETISSLTQHYDIQVFGVLSESGDVENFARIEYEDGFRKHYQTRNVTCDDNEARGYNNEQYKSVTYQGDRGTTITSEAYAFTPIIVWDVDHIRLERNPGAFEVLHYYVIDSNCDTLGGGRAVTIGFERESVVRENPVPLRRLGMSYFDTYIVGSTLWKDDIILSLEYGLVGYTDCEGNNYVRINE